MRARGFTLIELLIVVAIIGILAAIAVPNFLNARLKAQLSKAYAEMNTFVTSCEMYRLDNGVYFPHNHTPWQNKYLTTPIAYVTTIPTDPFQKGPGREEVQYSFNEYHKDPLWNMDGSAALDLYARHRQSPENIARGLRGKPWAYELWSVGPNGIVDQPAFIYYEATNGLDSPGMIVWIRP